MIIITTRWVDYRVQIPYYLGIVILASGVNALVAMRMVSALRGIARAATKFGQGDLDTRVAVNRRDELGLVAEAFNSMAERIQALVRRSTFPRSWRARSS